MGTTTRSLFLHGGPGLHSEAERRLLTPFFRIEDEYISYWNEPSTLRGSDPLLSGESAYSLLLKSAEQSFDELTSENRAIHLISHSFGANVASHLASRSPEKVSSLCFVQPSFHMNLTMKNILKLSLQDAQASVDTSRVLALSKALAETRSLYDEPMKRGFELAFEDPGIISHYWLNKKMMMAWSDIIGEAAYGVDAQRQAQVLSSFRPSHSFVNRLSIPAQVICGRMDRITSRGDELALVEDKFDLKSVILYENSAHFGHLEEADRFVQEIVRFHRRYGQRWDSIAAGDAPTDNRSKALDL